MLYFCRKRAACGLFGTSEPMPTTTPGTDSLPETAWIIARSSGELYMIARTLRNSGWKIDRPIVWSRSAVGTRIARAAGGARAVVRVVVAVAEEQAEVVVGGVLGDVVDQRRAGRPFGVEPVELVAERVALLEHAIGSLAEHQRIALVLHLEAAHLHAVDLLDAGGSSLRQVT